MWPLSALQYGLAFHARDAVDVYTTQTVLELGGVVGADRMRTAISLLLKELLVLYATRGDAAVLPRVPSYRVFLRGWGFA